MDGPEPNMIYYLTGTGLGYTGSPSVLAAPRPRSRKRPKAGKVKT